MPLFSIIIPVYRVEDYLEQCVCSVLQQSFINYEVILVDDGSPDNCPSLCDKLAERDSKIRVFHKSNGGLSDARNFGIKVSRGEYLLFIDSDDYWEAGDHLNNLAKMIYSDPHVDTIILKNKLLFEGRGAFFEVNINYSSLKHENSDLMLYNIVKAGYPASSAWSRVVRRSTIVDNDIYFTKGLTGEDSDWFINLSLYVKKYLVYDETIYVYRQNRSGSITDNIKLKNINDQLYILDKWNDILDSGNYSKYKYLALKGFLAYLFSIVIFLYSKLSKAERKFIFHEIKKRDSILSFSINPKSKQTKFLYKVFGLGLSSNLLAIIYKLRSNFRK